MSPTKFLSSMGVSALLLASASGTHAAALDVLFGTPGASITAGNEIFDQWTLIHNLSSTTPAALSAIDVTALNDGGTNPGPGLGFAISPSMQVFGDGVYAYFSLSFSFRAAIANSSSNIKIDDASLALGDAGLFSAGSLGCTATLGTTGIPCNDLGVSISEKVFADAARTIQLGNTMSVTANYLDGILTNKSNDGTVFTNQAQKQVWIEKNILLWSVNSGDTASLSGLSQRFSQTIPEPSSLMLLGVGLAAFARRPRS